MVERCYRQIRSWLLVVLALGAPVGAASRVAVERAPGSLIVSIDGRPFTAVHLNPGEGKPYLAPLQSAAGVLVTRHFPMEHVAGESTDHPHQKGLWIGYGTINGSNFWENEAANHTPNRGTVKLDEIAEAEGGDSSGRAVLTLTWMDKDAREIMKERRLLRFSGSGQDRVVDIDSTWTALTTVHFGDTKEGFFAIRVADQLNEQHGGKLLNAGGARGESAVWGKHSDWADYSGMIGGHPIGIAIFDHPANFHHPPRWHARGYGLFAVNPWGVKDFEPAASAPGGHTLEQGQTVRMRYRVLIHDGERTLTQLADLFNQYARAE